MKSHSIQILEFSLWLGNTQNSGITLETDIIGVDLVSPKDLIPNDNIEENYSKS